MMELTLTPQLKRVYSEIININNTNKNKYVISTDNFVLVLPQYSTEATCFKKDEKNEWKAKSMNAKKALNNIGLDIVEDEDDEKNFSETETVNDEEIPNDEVDKINGTYFFYYYLLIFNLRLQLFIIIFIARLKNINIKPVGKSVSQSEMARRINNLKLYLMNCKNIDADDEICNEVNWKDDKDERIAAISEIISFTSEKNAGKNNYVTIYKNLRQLDVWRDLYEEEYDDKGQTFKIDFTKASKLINDTTKSYTRYIRWSQINEKLPPGSYLSCNIPINHWRLIHADKFKEIVDRWDQF